MHRSFVLVASTLVLTLAMTPVSATAETEPQTETEAAQDSLVLGPNLIGNGGFEQGGATAEEPSTWRRTRAGIAQRHVTFSWDDEVAHSGERSVSIAIDDAHPNVEVNHNWNQHVTGFEPGARYLVSAWVKGENLKETAFFVVQCWNYQMSEVLRVASNQQGDEVIGTTDWIRIETTLEVPQKTGRMVVLAGLASPENRGGRVWFDDVAIQRIGGQESEESDESGESEASE